MNVFILLSFACGSESSGFLVDLEDLGEDYATGLGFSFDSPQAAWMAAEHVAPEITWGIPGTNIPSYLWIEAMSGENVADTGSCPYVTLEGGTTTWTSNCRSQEGFDWVGEVSITVEEGEETTRTTTVYDIDVSTDLAGKAFTSITIEGTTLQIDGDSAPLKRHVQSNVRILAEGYWSGAFDDELESAWSEIAISGVWEIHDKEIGDSILFDARIDLGSYGGFAGQSEDLSQDPGCVGEPKGTVQMQGENEATLIFEGPDLCNGCAEFYADGERGPNACRG